MNACRVLELATNNNILQIIELAKKEILENTIKQKHGMSELKRYKLALKYLKNAEECNATYGNTWIKNGLQCFTNGYTAFILKKHINNLPEVSSENKINLEEHSKIDTNIMHKVEFNIADVKTKLKIFKAENKSHKNLYPHYDIGESRYNAKYLIDCYTILGGDNIEFYQPKNGELCPSIFQSENGATLIMPVRKSK